LITVFGQKHMDRHRLLTLYSWNIF